MWLSVRKKKSLVELALNFERQVFSFCDLGVSHLVVQIDR